jgi:hypothetical protein
VIGEEQTAGDLGASGASALTSPRSRVGVLTRGSLASEILGAVRRFLRAKAQHFPDVCGCCYPLASEVVGTFSVIGIWVKTLDHRSSRWQRDASLAS